MPRRVMLQSTSRHNGSERQTYHRPINRIIAADKERALPNLTSQTQSINRGRHICVNNVPKVSYMYVKVRRPWVNSKGRNPRILISIPPAVRYRTNAINQSSFITGMPERTPANTQQANTQQFINRSRVSVLSFPSAT